MRRGWGLYLEILGDLMIIFGGGLLLYIFVVIEIAGGYGQEPNRYIRWIEIALGPGVIILGANRLWRDITRRRHGTRPS